MTTEPGLFDVEPQPPAPQPLPHIVAFLTALEPSTCIRCGGGIREGEEFGVEQGHGHVCEDCLP